jgi:hypothetical protein
MKILYITKPHLDVYKSSNTGNINYTITVRYCIVSTTHKDKVHTLKKQYYYLSTPFEAHLPRDTLKTMLKPEYVGAYDEIRALDDDTAPIILFRDDDSDE